MRPIARLIAPILAAASLVLAIGVPATLAASGDSAKPAILDLHEEWCFDDSPGYLYCFEVDGQALFRETGSASTLTIHSRFHTVASKDGVVVGESTDISVLRSVSRADGTDTTQEITNTRASFGDVRCHYQAVLKIVDYELVIDHVNSSCGG